jgi:hypothetical protein
MYYRIQTKVGQTRVSTNRHRTMHDPANPLLGVREHSPGYGYTVRFQDICLKLFSYSGAVEFPVPATVIILSLSTFFTL